MKKLFLVLTLLSSSFSQAEAQCAAIFDQNFPKLHSSKSVDLCEITAGKTVLIVNTASKCGYTPQFEQLQSLYQQYESQDFTIIGFPSNDFRQEENDEEKIADICYTNFGVKFTMVQPVHVKGAQAINIFDDLAEQAGEFPQWNFHKYLVDKDGQLIESFASNVNPISDEITEAIEDTLSSIQ
jgi:glutathione peroxidase